MGKNKARARRNGLRSFFALALSTASALALSVPAAAQQSEAGATQHAERDYNIPAQPLALALLQFSEQSNLQILYAQDDLAGLQSRPIRGRFTPHAALAQLLPPGSPHVEITNNAHVSVRQSPQHAGRDSADLDNELVVTGTRIRGAAPAGAHVLRINRSTIDETSRSSVIDVLQTLPQVFPGSQNESTQLLTNSSGNNIAFGSTIDLRGLGADATLTLINGRRAAPAGFGNFVDVGAVPLSAIDRIEVLADGASATYGSDAIGGVVNIILRRDFSGAETRLRFGEATSGGLREYGVSHLAGLNGRKGNLLVGYEYRERERLAAADRTFASNTDLRALGGDDFSRNFADPGTIIRVGATNVSYAIPRNQNGLTLAQSDFVAGTANLQNGNLNRDLAPEQTSHALFAAGHFQVNTQIGLFADLILTRREASARDSQLTGTLIVPATNAYRTLNNLFPGGGDLRIAYAFHGDLGPVRYGTQADALLLTGGGDIRLPGGWRSEISVTYAQHEDEALVDNAADTSVLAPFLASNDLATAFNPFADGGNSPSAVIAAMRRQQRTFNQSELVNYALRFDGPTLALPGGLAQVAFGIERRDQSFEVVRHRIPASGAIIVQETQAPGERTTDAIYVELLAPMIGPENRIPFLYDVDLSLSVRHERSDDFGEATTPKIGVSWALAPDVRLRASWGESYKAPRFDQTRSGISGTYGVASPAIDPYATDGSTGLLQILGGNPNLTPEEAVVWTAGFDLTPTWAPGFRIQAGYFDITFENRIATPGIITYAIRNAAAFPNNLFRDPSADLLAYFMSLDSDIAGTPPPDGVELIWDARLTNISSQRMRGVDITASYARDFAMGTLSLSLSASHVLEFSQQADPAAAALNRVDIIHHPIDWRGTFTTAWRSGPWRIGATALYADDYHDTLSTPNRRIKSWLTWDLHGSYRWGDDKHGARSTELALNLRNLFNEDPPFVNNALGFGYDPQNASPAGRVFSVELRQRW